MNLEALDLSYLISGPEHACLASGISALIEEASKEPGVALARRTPEYSSFRYPNIQPPSFLGSRQIQLS